MSFDPASLRQFWPMPSRPKPIVAIGAGSIVVDAHFPAYRKAGFPIAGIYDLDRPRAKSVAEKFGVAKVFGSLDEAVARILGLIAAHGDAVVGALDDNQVEISVEVVAGANELGEFAENLPPRSSVVVGAFPTADDDGHDAVTLSLSDRDRITRGHRY